MRGSNQYGLGYHRGRSSMLADILAAQADALAKTKAQRQAANRDALAGAIGSFIAQLIPVTVRAVREHKRRGAAADE